MARLRFADDRVWLSPPAMLADHGLSYQTHWNPKGGVFLEKKYNHLMRWMINQWVIADDVKANDA